jgi:rare lipoprotein A
MAAIVGFAALIAACRNTPPPRENPLQNERRHTAPLSPLPPAALPPSSQAVPDAVPRIEPRSRYGNPPFYDVFGKRYYVLSSSAGYVERGVASWYGPGFHEVRTSTGEPYDMYGMTAAHKTLPLPAYVRVTNLQNARSIVVRVNDRGPFVGNRIIDLSYTAAVKLDMLRNGTAIVEIRAIVPAAPESAIQAANAMPVVGASATAVAAPPVAATLAAHAPGAPAANGTLYIQAGAFADPANAERLAKSLRGGNYGKVFVRTDQIAGRRMYRVRIGPVVGVEEFDRIVAALDKAGISDAHLALD